ncbi:MAG: hypothetical protein ACK536_02695, partial [Hyphomonadaceae bacterium]
QSGDGAVSMIEQDRDNNTLNLTQTAKAESWITQTGSGGLVDVSQYVDGAYSSVTQTGMGNSATVVQGSPSK